MCPTLSSKLIAIDEWNAQPPFDDLMRQLLYQDFPILWVLYEMMCSHATTRTHSTRECKIIPNKPRVKCNSTQIAYPTDWFRGIWWLWVLSCVVTKTSERIFQINNPRPWKDSFRLLISTSHPLPRQYVNWLGQRMSSSMQTGRHSLSRPVYRGVWHSCLFLRNGGTEHLYKWCVVSYCNIAGKATSFDVSRLIRIG